MKHWFTLRDNISGVIMEFSTKEDAEKEAARLLKKYREGYDIRRAHIAGCNAVIIENGQDLIITVLK